MLSNRKMLYQVKLILDYLPEEEYRLIPQDMINYIENNYASVNKPKDIFL